jgi:anti-anti-sigma factor
LFAGSAISVYLDQLSEEENYMDIVVSQEKGRRPVTVFHVTGEINSATYEQFEQQARDAYAAGTRDLLIDLAACDYVSSAGIRALNTLVKLLRTDSPQESDEAMSKGLRDGTWKSPHLKLVNVSKRIADTLKMAGVDMLLEMHDNLKEAIDSF